MYNFPEYLETERLIIRPARPEDAEIFHKAIINSFKELQLWLSWVKNDFTLGEATRTCREAYGKFLLNQDIMVFFIDKKTNELVGASGLMKPIWDLGIFEVGYWCNTKYTKKGLMTEGLLSLCDYAINTLKANRLYLTTDDENIDSWKLAERAGFKHEGTLRKDKLNLNGDFRNTRVYSIIREDFFFNINN